MIGIYKITSPSGKIYIGSSIDIKYRIKYYKNLCCQGQVKLYNSLKKYGWHKHKFEIVTECSVEELYLLERTYGEMFDVLSKNGLNLILPKVGENKVGVSEETRERMRNRKGGYASRPHTESAKEKIRQFQTGRKHTAEHRRKVSENNARNNAKIVVDMENGIFYDSIKEAAWARNENHSSLKNRVNGYSPTYTPIKICGWLNEKRNVA
jgi:group I intron endonuclease